MYKMPKIGLRTIKTAIAVFICLCFAHNSPFFAANATIFCIQNTQDSSLQAGLTRGLGTMLGGLLGLVFLLLCRGVATISMPGFLLEIVTNFIICIGIILTIHMFNLLKRPAWIPIGCIVFLAVTTANADSNPFYYAFVRCEETLFGMAIGLMVNRFICPPDHYGDTKKGFEKKAS